MSIFRQLISKIVPFTLYPGIFTFYEVFYSGECFGSREEFLDLLPPFKSGKVEVSSSLIYI